MALSRGEVTSRNTVTPLLVIRLLAPNPEGKTTYLGVEIPASVRKI